MPMSTSLLILVVIAAVVGGGIRYLNLTRKNPDDATVGRSPATGALRTFGWTLGLGLLLGVGFIGWVVYSMAPAA